MKYKHKYHADILEMKYKHEYHADILIDITIMQYSRDEI